MKKGMIKGTVLYPNGDGKKFDMDYYCNTHLPMVAGLMGDSLKGSTVEKGIASGNDRPLQKEQTGDLKGQTGLSNKQWDKAIKGLTKNQLAKVEKTDAGLFVELV